MNESHEVKQPEDVNLKKAEEMAQTILQNSIDEQNEIFQRLRIILVKERQDYIDRESEENNAKRNAIEYARDTLASIFMAELK